MPGPDSILEWAAAVANEWRWIAVAWHGALAGLLIGIAAGWRPTPRVFGTLLCLPLVSVSVLAWLSGNPFNGTAFAVIAAALAVAAANLKGAAVSAAATGWVIPGAAMVAFGWTYPHFVRAETWGTYLYASPFGLLPCPTLSVLIGITLIVGGFRSILWGGVLAAAGITYGVIGVARLGVGLDGWLLAGATLLGVQTLGALPGLLREPRSTLLARRVETPRDELLDRFMPNYDVVERHQVSVDAPCAVTLQAAKEQDLQQSPLVRAIFKARELIMGAIPDDRAARPRELLPLMRSLGWGVLADVPGREIVMGAVTRPWEANVTFHALPPNEFASFTEPGFVKIAWTLRADAAAGGGSVFRTETRAAATDEMARARFRRYWAWVSPGIALIRRLLLGPVKREAERRAHAAAG